MKKKIVLIGAGGHAKSCIDVIENSSKEFVIFGLVDKLKVKKKIFNYNIIGSERDLITLRKKIKFAFIAIGQIKSPYKRIKIFNNLKKIGYKLPTIISKKAYISKNSKIGIGTIIMHGAIINAGVKIGRNCIINTGSIIEHDVKIDDNVHVAPGAIVLGNCHVKENTFVGSGVIIKQNTSIQRNSILATKKYYKQ